MSAMNAGFLLGLDFGTGGAKVCALAVGGEVRHQAYEEYPQFHDRPGYSEHDPAHYWQAARRLIAGTVAEVGGNFVAIAISCALPSLVMVDARGEPIGRAINLMDRRAWREAGEVIERIGADRLQELTGNRVEDHPAMVNLLWLARHEPAAFARASAGLTIDGFVAMQLTGRATLNRSAAAFYGVAYDIRRCRFDESVLAELGIPVQKLPELVDCDEVIGTVSAQVAADLGVSPGCAVVGGQVDCNAAWIGGGAVAPGDFQLNLGTCGVIGVVHDQPQFLSTPAGRQVVNIPYTTDPRRVYSAVAVTMTGGQALRYLRDLIGAAERDAAAAQNVSPYDMLTRLAAEVPPGSEGLLALPYLMGERVPLWDSTARAAYVGLSLHHQRAHLIRAMLEGVAYALRWALDVLREGELTIREPLVLNEGGARSVLWRRILTDVLEVSTTRVVGGGGAALGDAILAGVAVEALPGFAAAKDFCATGEILEPDPQAVSVYRAGLETFQATYEALRGPAAKLVGDSR
jgi:sugar (pentulose or hexulose) kinase